MGFGFDRDEANLGLFGDSEAVRNLENSRMSSDPEGLVVSTACQTCGVEVSALVPWSELYCVSQGILPQQVGLSQWVTNNPKGNSRPTTAPHLTCRRCNRLVLFAIPVEEAQRHVTQISREERQQPGSMSPQQRALIGQIAAKLQAKRPGR